LKKFQKFLFADLDDTLFQSLEKCAVPEGLLPAAFLRDGSPISYTTPGQRAFIAFAQDGMTMIPTTARNLDAFKRVDLPFASWAAPSTANGRPACTPPCRPPCPACASWPA
jgi:hypothetical protein